MSDIDRASDRSNSDAENLIFTIVDDGGSVQQRAAATQENLYKNHYSRRAHANCHASTKTNDKKNAIKEKERKRIK